MNKLFFLVTIALVTSCAASSRTVRFGDRLVGVDGECNPRVYSATDRPKTFLAMGRVEAESFDGSQGLTDKLIKGACSLGADGLVDVRLETYDTVRSRFDEKTRESSLEKGAQIHTATAIAIKSIESPETTPVSPDGVTSASPPTEQSDASNPAPSITEPPVNKTTPELQTATSQRRPDTSKSEKVVDPSRTKQPQSKETTPPNAPKQSLLDELIDELPQLIPEP